MNTNLINLSQKSKANFPEYIYKLLTKTYKITNTIIKSKFNEKKKQNLID